MFGCKNKCDNRIAALKARIDELEEELHLEVTWAEGEVAFWEQQVILLEDELAKKNKPWWRHIIS